VTRVRRSSVNILLRSVLEILLKWSSDLGEEVKYKCTAQVCAGDPAEVEQ